MAENHKPAPVFENTTLIKGLLLDALKDTSEAIDRTLADPRGQAVVERLANLDPLPYQAQTKHYWRDIEPSKIVVACDYFASSGWRERIAETWWHTSRTLSNLIDTRPLGPNPLPGTPESAARMQSLLTWFEGGTLTRLGNKLDDAITRITLPTALLRIATGALVETAYSKMTDEERGLRPSEQRALALERADLQVRAMCTNIATGEKPAPKPRDKATTAEKLAWGAMSALRRSYTLGETADERQRLCEPLVVLGLVNSFANVAQISGQDLSRLAEEKIKIGTPKTFEDLKDSVHLDLNAIMPRVGLKINRILMALGLPDSEEQIMDLRLERAASQMALQFHTSKTTKGELLKHLNGVHADLRMRQVARTLVDGIAGGELSFMPVYLAGTLANSRVLGERAELNAAKRQAAQQAEDAARQQITEDQERRRAIQRLEIEEKLRAIGLEWEVLPKGEGSGLPKQASASDRNQAEAHSTSNSAEIDPYRLAVLFDIQRAFGGEIYRSNFKHGKKTTASNAEVYYVLVFNEAQPDGSIINIAMAECASVANSLYLYRSDMPGIPPWELVFSGDKSHALRNGALPIPHPSKTLRDVDPQGVADRFGMKVLEHAYMSPEAFLEAWAKAARRLFGKTATAATVDTGIKQD